MSTAYAADRATLLHGEALQHLLDLPDHHVDAVITDLDSEAEAKGDEWYRYEDMIALVVVTHRLDEAARATDGATRNERLRQARAVTIALAQQREESDGGAR